MLRRCFLAAGMLLGLQAGAWADFAVDSFIAYQKGQNVDFAISAHNADDVVQQGPIKIKVLSTTDGQSWNELQSWNVELLPSGGGWNQNFTVNGEGAKAKGKNYEAKIVIEYPGDERLIHKQEEYARIILGGK